MRSRWRCRRSRSWVLMGTSTAYYEKAYAMYSNTKNVQGGNGLYSKTDHCGGAIKTSIRPTPSRTARILLVARQRLGFRGAGPGARHHARQRGAPRRVPRRLPGDVGGAARGAAHRRILEREPSRPTHFGGKELTGTALFTYGMAWGVRKGICSERRTAGGREGVERHGRRSVHTDGFLGWVQGTGKQPSDGQPLSADKIPDFEDYGLGCFLLGGVGIARLAAP